MYVIKVLYPKKGIITFCTMIVSSVRLSMFLDCYRLLWTVMYYFRWLYRTFDCYILLLNAISYFGGLYTTCDGYILLSVLYSTLALLDCDFLKIQDIPANSHICGLGLKYL